MPTKGLSKLAADFLRNKPDVPSRTAARELCRLYPTEFTSLERARSAVRRILGNNGKQHRDDMDNKSLFRPARKAGEVRVPAAAASKDRSPFILDVTGNVLVLSDIHLPYHDENALEIALKDGMDRGCKGVLLNGDILDFYALSRWEKDPQQRDLRNEVLVGRAFLQLVRECFPKARIVWKMGNHEERHESWMYAHGQDWLGFPEFELFSLLLCDRYGIEVVKDKRIIRLGKLNVIHGHEYRFNISNPVNPARGFFLRAKACVLGGHLHQTSHHSERNLEGRQVSAWSQGCLCNLSPDYAPLNNWDHSFSIVTVKGDDFHVSPRRIVNGKLV